MRLIDALPRRLRGGLAGDTLAVGFWQAVRVAGQAIWVILIARLLGPDGYGTFVGVAGLATTLGGLTGLGMGLVMLQDVARQSALFDRRWRQAITVCLGSGAVLCAAFVLIAPWLFGGQVTFVVIAALGLSELLLFPLISLSAFAFSSRSRMGTAAALPAVMAAGRTLAALAFWLMTSQRTLEVYIGFHLLATLGCALLALFWVRRQLKPAPVAFEMSLRELREGGGFSLMWMVGNGLSSLDKTLVLRLAGAQVAGLYGVIYRFATVLALPVEALTMAAGPRLFRHGGGQTHAGLIPRMALLALGYSVLAGAALALLAGVLPWLLGPRFEPAVEGARWMALFVPAYAMRLLGSNVLMASNARIVRVVIEAMGLLALGAFALLWLPTYGLKGAVLMICTTEALLALACWTLIWRRGLSGSVAPVRSAAPDSRPPTARR